MKKVGDNLSLTKEADDINYFSLNEIPANTVQRHIERIEDFYNDNEKMILKGYYSSECKGI